MRRIGACFALFCVLTVCARSAPVSGIGPSAFAHPSTAVPSGSTTFEPSAGGSLFLAQLSAKMQNKPNGQALQNYAAQVNKMVEQAYVEYGFSKNDVGAALGALLETTWELSSGTYKTGGATAQDKARTRAAVRQMQNALLASPAFGAMSDAKKELLYGACTFLMGDLATRWQMAGSDGAKRAAVRQDARKQLETFFGVSAASLTRRPDGTFAAKSAASTAKAPPAPNNGGARLSHAPPLSGVGGHNLLPPASARGARVFVKYVFQTTSTRFAQLILFPDGAAFTDVPSSPVSRFDEATLRATLKPYDIGTWKQSGSTLTLSFPHNTSERVTTLRKVPKGWYDGSGKLDADSSYDTYFPVRPLTPAALAGAWESQSLSTMGFAGGAAPMVAGGSSSRRVFYKNGTFSGARESFASATTANEGLASDNGSVGFYSTNSKRGAGRWRLDGPLLTIEAGGKRSVVLAFVLPHWNKTGPPEMLMDGDWWQRPERK